MNNQLNISNLNQNSLNIQSDNELPFDIVYYAEYETCENFTNLMKLVLYAKHSRHIVDVIKKYLLENPSELNKVNAKGHTALHISFLNMETYSSREIYELLLNTENVEVDNCVVDNVCLLNTLIEYSLKDKKYLSYLDDALKIAKLSNNYISIIDIDFHNRNRNIDPDFSQKDHEFSSMITSEQFIELKKSKRTYDQIFAKIIDKLLYTNNMSSCHLLTYIIAKYSIFNSHVSYVDMILTHPNFHKYCNSFTYPLLYYLLFVISNNKKIIENYLCYDIIFKYTDFSLFTKCNNIIEILVSLPISEKYIMAFLKHPNLNIENIVNKELNFLLKYRVNSMTDKEIIMERNSVRGCCDPMYLCDKKESDIIDKIIMNLDSKYFAVDSIWNSIHKRSILFFSKYNMTDHVETLFNGNYGVDIDYKDKYGNTALMYASKNGNPRLVKLLVNKGACTHSKNIYNKSPRDYAFDILLE